MLWLIACVSCFTKANGVYYNQTNFEEKYSGLVWWSLILIYIVEFLKSASQANCNQVQKQVFYCAPASLTPATGEPFKVTQESPIHISGWDLYHSFKEQKFCIWYLVMNYFFINIKPSIPQKLSGDFIILMIITFKNQYTTFYHITNNSTFPCVCI